MTAHEVKWTLALLAALALTACGDDASGTDSGAPDAGLDAGLMACVHVDGRGGAAADGSVSAPYATIDDALTAGAARICLSAGSFPPPTVAIARSVRIEGITGDPERADASVIRGDSLSCRPVIVPRLTEADPPLAGNAAFEVAATGTLLLSGVRITGCDLAVVVIGGTLDLSAATVDGVRGGVAVWAAGQVRVAGTKLSLNPNSGTLGGPLPFGVLALEGSLAELTGGSLIVGRDITAGVVAIKSSLTVADTTLEGGLFGVFADQGDGSATLTTLGPNLTVRDLHRVRGGMSSDVAASSRILGGRVDVKDVSFEDIEGSGLEVSRASGATFSDLRFMGCTRNGLGLFGTDAELRGELRFEIPSGATGLYVSDVVPTSAELFPSSVVVSASVASVAEAAAFHVGVRGSTLLFTSISLDLAGGTNALFASHGGRIEVRAGASIHDLDAGFVSPGGQQPFAIGARDDGSAVVLNDVEIILPPQALGLGARDATSVEWTAGSIAGGSVGVLGADAAHINVTGLEIQRTSLTGFGLLDAASGSFTTGRIHEGGGVGIVTSDRSRMRLERSLIDHNEWTGAESQGGGRLEIRGTTFESNGGAAVSFYDASGFIVGSMFSAGSRLVDIAGVMRADEVRVVSTDGAVHEVLLGDDGDGTVLADEENRFELEARAGCDGGGCTLLFGDGMGVNGVISPNCIVAMAPGGAVHTVVGQNGASMTVVGGGSGSAWADALGGIGSDLGLDPGSSSPVGSSLSVARPDLVPLPGAL